MSRKTVGYLLFGLGIAWVAAYTGENFAIMVLGSFALGLGAAFLGEE